MTSHVHIMSPDLIAYWKDLGIPFSNAEDHYANIDTILQNNQAKYIALIGMGYVFANPEYYQGDDSKERLQAENDYLLRVADDHVNRVKPYFAVDPLKDYALDEIERCHTINNNVGLKLHFNTSQVYLTEPIHLEKVKRVFKKVADLKIPVLLHFDNWHPKFGKPDIQLLHDSILSPISSIDLQIAHFGTSGGFNKKTKRFIEGYIDIRNKSTILDKHDIYFDISAVALDKDSEGVSKLTSEEFSELKSYIDKLGLDHIIFGTDYPLYRSKEYGDILVEKVGLTREELESISQQRR